MQVRAGAHSIHAQTNDLGAERTLKKVPLPHDSMIMTIMRMILMRVPLRMMKHRNDSHMIPHGCHSLTLAGVL